MALLSKNLLKAALEDIELSGEYMNALVEGWLMGKQAKPLFGIQWNILWETPLETLRTQLNLNVRSALSQIAISAFQHLG